ncbi:hypothetical protein Ancab_037297 [Ancistrocladus abbreviatus]
MVTAATYKVNLHCPECVDKIRKALLRTPGVHNVDVNFEKSEVKVVGIIDAKKMHEKLRHKLKCHLAGHLCDEEFSKADDCLFAQMILILHTTTIKAHMHCDQCEYDLRRKLLKHKGIYSVKTDMKAQSLTIEGSIEPDKLVAYMREKVHKHTEILNTKQPKKEEKKESKAKEERAEEKKEEGKTDFKIIKVIDAEEVKEVEEKLRESNTPYIIHYVYAPQLFSDEDPNSCSII